MLKAALISLSLWIHAALAAGPVLEVDRPQVNIRADATVQSVRIAVLQEGERVERVAQKDEWNQIRLPDGRLGWLHGNTRNLDRHGRACACGHRVQRRPRRQQL